MKKFIVKYMLYIYLNFIKNNDLDSFKKGALPFIKTLDFIRGIYIWLASVIFFPIFVFDMMIYYRFDIDKKIAEIVKSYQK